MKPFVAFGHSHIVAIAKAYYGLSGEYPPVDFNWLHDPSLLPNSSSEGLNPAIRAKIKESNVCFVLMAAGGNEHNLIGVSSEPGPFDFVLPEDPDGVIEPAARLVPAALVRAAMARHLAGCFALLRVMAHEAGVPVLQIEPPPPVPDEDLIARALAERNVSTGIRPRRLRHKLWRLQSMLYREACQNSGVTFLPCPPEVVTPDGMMVREAWGEDGNHANAWYGERVIRQIERATA